MANKNVRLVYSTDGAHLKICKACREQPCLCKKVVPVRPADFVTKIRLEKSGRGGKMVTLIFNLPHNPEYFKKLCKKLKSHCGSGGTYKDDTIEIQGDHRVRIQSFLESQGFAVKLAGG